MKIRLAMVEQDSNYAKKLINNFQMLYGDKIEVYYFSSYEFFEEYIKDNLIHIALIGEETEIDGESMREDISWAYLVSGKEIEEYRGKPAVCKYQKVELIYKNVLSLFAEMEQTLLVKGVRGKNKIMLFTSAQGGAGSSALAAAYAVNKAGGGASVIYTTLDRFQRTGSYFAGEGGMSFSDVIYAIKSKKANLAIKLESILKKDKSGVNFFDTVKNAYDMLELTEEDMRQLLNALRSMEGYEYIVMDVPLDFSPACRTLLEEYADEIVLVNDGSETGNVKFQRAVEILTLWEQNNKGAILAKCRLIYNRFASATGKKLVDIPIETIGGIGRIEGASYEQLIKALSTQEAIEHMN